MKAKNFYLTKTIPFMILLSLLSISVSATPIGAPEERDDTPRDLVHDLSNGRLAYLVSGNPIIEITGSLTAEPSADREPVIYLYGNIGESCTVILKDVHINASVCPLSMSHGMNPTLILEGDNVLEAKAFDYELPIKGGTITMRSRQPGIELGNGSTLTIRGNGSLVARGGEGPGIGGFHDKDKKKSTIIVESGTVTAIGEAYCPGIGGMSVFRPGEEDILAGQSANVIIRGGRVTAQKGALSNNTDIGASENGGAPDRIEISGGVVVGTMFPQPVNSADIPVHRVTLDFVGVAFGTPLSGRTLFNDMTYGTANMTTDDVFWMPEGTYAQGKIIVGVNGVGFANKAKEDVVISEDSKWDDLGIALEKAFSTVNYRLAEGSEGYTMSASYSNPVYEGEFGNGSLVMSGGELTLTIDGVDGSKQHQFILEGTGLPFGRDRIATNTNPIRIPVTDDMDIKCSVSFGNRLNIAINEGARKTRNIRATLGADEWYESEISFFPESDALANGEVIDKGDLVLTVSGSNEEGVRYEWNVEGVGDDYRQEGNKLIIPSSKVRTNGSIEVMCNVKSRITFEVDGGAATGLTMNANYDNQPILNGEWVLIGGNLHLEVLGAQQQAEYRWSYSGLPTSYTSSLNEYTINGVDRPMHVTCYIQGIGSTNAYLSNLSVDNNAFLSPTIFNPDHVTYSITVYDKDVQSITITAEQSHENAIVSLKNNAGQGQINKDGNNNIITVPVSRGSTVTYTINVLAENRKTEKDYIIMVQYPFGTGIAQTAAQDVRVSLNGQDLSVDSPDAEQVTVYSAAGTLLNRLEKSAGKVSFAVASTGSKQVLVVRGSSGWAKKIVR